MAMMLSSELSESSKTSSNRPESAFDSPRERTEADEQRRRTVSVIPREAGVNMWDRPDWPLSSPSDVDGLEIRQALREERGVEEAVLRKPRDLCVRLGGEYDYAFDEHDVSDVEEEEEEDIEEDDVEMLQTPSTLSHSQFPSLQLRQDSSFHLHPSPSPSESHKAAAQALESPQHPSIQPDVSSIQEHEEDQHKQYHATSNGTLATKDRVGNTEYQHRNGRPESPRRQSSIQLQPNGQSTSSSLNDDDAAAEARDILVAPIVPSTPRANDSPVLQQGSRLSYHALPSSNNSRVSLAKAPMHSPPSRRISARSSQYTTTQIPHNKERLRYSWQSLQDDEPNRPRIHIIKLVSNTATASAGFPTGEALGFSISPGGRRIAAYNSARLYVLQTAALPVGISQDYALKRRPLAVELTDEGSTMAILTDDHTVNVYDLGLQLRRKRTIKLDFTTNCIALAPSGGLLAAAYEGGIEIFSLDANALPTDRRAVRSIRMDRMSFSEDGSTLLGTTTRVNVSSTVVVSVPIFPAAADGVPSHTELKEAWCSELLHPENIRNSSHAVFMRESRKTCNDKLFAWNGLEDTFGLLQVAHMHYGHVDFPVVISPPLSTCGGLGAAIHSSPAIDECGDTVAMIVNDRTIRLYIVPSKHLDDRIPVEAHSIDHELDEGYGCPFSEVRWVHNSASIPSSTDGSHSVKGRLIVTSPGGVNESGISDESVEDIEGGRIILFDFDPQFAGQPGQTFSLSLGKSPPQMLEEEQVDVAEQVALVRRRTVNQNQRGGLSQRPPTLGRAATTYGSSLGRGMSNPSSIGSGRSNRTSMISIGTLQSEGARSLPDLMENGEQAEFCEEPYVQGAPRSHASLQRAASNAQRHRYQALEERNRESISVESTGNFLPLPEYSGEPNAPLPQRFRALAGLDAPTSFQGLDGLARGGRAASSQGLPLTAPPDVGEHFSADRAFRNANARHEGRTSAHSSVNMTSGIGFSVYNREASPIHTAAASIRSESTTSNNFYPTLRGGENQRPTSPTTSTRTMDPSSAHPQPQLRPGPYGTPSFLPRSLQRAYSNAVSPLTNAGPSPVPGNDSRSASRAGNVSAMGTYYAGSVQEDEPWDVISPVGTTAPWSPFGKRVSLMGNLNRFSQQQQYQQPLDSRNASVTSSSVGYAASQRPAATESRHLPPHMLAFRQAAAANANANATSHATSASLFPATVPRDHVPIRQPAGKDGYAVTGWRPPAPSSVSTLPESSGSGGSHNSGDRSGKKGRFSRKEKTVETFGKDRDGSVGVWIPERRGKERRGCVVM